MRNGENDNWFLLDDEALALIRKAATGAVTQSEMMLRASCARKWFYRYALKLERRGYLDHNLLYGSLMHSLLELLYSSGQHISLPKDAPIKLTIAMIEAHTQGALLRPKDYPEIELTAKKAQIAFNAYRHHWCRQDAKLMIKQVERVSEVSWEGLRLACKMDLVAKPTRRDGTFIWDFKTAGQLDATALDAWTFRFQFLFYCWMWWKLTGVKPTGIMINGLVKTGLRPRIVDKKSGRKETEEEYLFRVKGDMAANRAKYFYRQRIPLGKDMLERFEVEILRPHVQAFKTMRYVNSRQLFLVEAINALAMQMNTNQCHLYNSYCEYLSLCKDGQISLGEFDTRKYKHRELET